MEEDYIIFHGSGEGERRVERQVKKMQVTAERLAQMFGVSHTADYCNIELMFSKRRVYPRTLFPSHQTGK